MVGVAGDVGGLTLYSDYRPERGRRHDRAWSPSAPRCTPRAQLLTRGFQDTMAIAGLSAKDAFAALGLAPSARCSRRSAR